MVILCKHFLLLLIITPLGNKTMPWIAKAAKDAASNGKPFFAHLSPHAPHLPATPAPWYKEAPLPSQFAPRLPSFNNFSKICKTMIGQTRKPAFILMC